MYTHMASSQEVPMLSLWNDPCFSGLPCIVLPQNGTLSVDLQASTIVSIIILFVNDFPLIACMKKEGNSILTDVVT